jgi:hypothetical protein
MFFVLMVFIMGVYVGTATAQVVPPAGLTVWQGSEWQISATAKGYEFDTVTNPPSGKVKGTIKFQAVMDVVLTDDVTPTGEIRVTLYQVGDGPCDVSSFGTLVMNYVAGDSTAFAAESVPALSTLPVTGVFYFSGSSGNKGLKGKVETVGAYLIADLDPFETIGLNIKGSVKDLKCTPLNGL